MPHSMQKELGCYDKHMHLRQTLNNHMYSKYAKEFWKCLKIPGEILHV